MTLELVSAPVYCFPSKERIILMPYFEFIGEDASRKSERAEKYWEITQVGKNVTVRFGKIGAAGQLKVKEFATTEEAEAEAAKLIKEKTKKGYIEKPNPH